MGLFIPIKINNIRRKDRDIECEIVWALFEDETSSYSWEKVKDLPDWFVDEHKDYITKMTSKLNWFKAIKDNKSKI